MCLFLIKVYVPLVTNTERTKVAARSIFQHEADGAVVRTEDIGEDGGVFNAVGESVADDVVVDAPAGILLPRLEAVGPVGVGFDGFRVKVTESVSEPRFKEFRELSSFLVGEACAETIENVLVSVLFLCSKSSFALFALLYLSCSLVVLWFFPKGIPFSQEVLVS